MSYTTTPGTIPHRVVQHLATLPPGAEISTAALSELLDQPGLYLRQYLQPLREAGGLVARRQLGSKNLLWRLPIPGDLAPQPDADVAASDGPDDAPMVRRVVPAATLKAPRPEPVAASKRPGKASPPAAVASASAAATFRVALWSDGSLVIERGANTVQFSKVEARQIMAYLARQPGEGA